MPELTFDELRISTSSDVLSKEKWNGLVDKVEQQMTLSVPSEGNAHIKKGLTIGGSVGIGTTSTAAGYPLDVVAEKWGGLLISSKSKQHDSVLKLFTQRNDLNKHFWGSAPGEGTVGSGNKGWMIQAIHANHADQSAKENLRIFYHNDAKWTNFLRFDAKSETGRVKANHFQVNYLEPGNKDTSHNYEYIRFGTPELYFGGIMHNISNKPGWGNGDDFVLFSYGSRDINIRPGGNTYFARGNVGIGKTNPRVKLDVSGSASISKDASISGSLSILSDTVLISNKVSNKARLRVKGSIKNNNFRKYNYLSSNPSNRIGWFDQPNNHPQISIWADQRIVSSEFMAKSDGRIKNVIGTSDSAKDLQILQQLKIRDYSYKDFLTHPNKIYKKVIGQEVAKVFPNAVAKNSSEFIPDIMEVAILKDQWITLNDHALKKGDKIKIIHTDESLELIVEAVEQNRFKIMSKKSGHVLIHGREVKDFHTVDYEALAMLNISATQEILRRLEQVEQNLHKNDRPVFLTKN